jgi:hypothetical protein
VARRFADQQDHPPPDPERDVCAEAAAVGDDGGELNRS